MEMPIDEVGVYGSLLFDDSRKGNWLQPFSAYWLLGGGNWKKKTQGQAKGRAFKWLVRALKEEREKSRGASRMLEVSLLCENSLIIVIPLRDTKLDFGVELVAKSISL